MCRKTMRFVELKIVKLTLGGKPGKEALSVGDANSESERCK